jgi:CHRD domain
MHGSMAVLAVPLAAAAVLAAPGTAGASSTAFGVVAMTGAQEVPGPGDPDGRGLFSYVATPDQLCYALLIRRIAPATAAHVHAGAPGVAGPIVVTLLTPTGGLSAGCIAAVPDAWQNTANAATTLTVSELRAIVRDPAAFYANVHTADHPKGALRGQLG